MQLGMIIGSTIAIFIIGIALRIYYNTKDRKEPLTIWVDGDTVRLLLSEDDYCNFDISDIREKQERINEELIKVIQKRARELVEFVDKVSFFNNKNENFANELLKIIQRG